MAGPTFVSAGGASLRAWAAGFALPLEGFRLLRAERSLWPWALLPVLLSLVAVASAGTLMVAHAATLHQWATGWMPQLVAEGWLDWLWVGPARALLLLVGALLFLVLAAAALVAAYLVASVLASPFHDQLSARVERLETGRVHDATDQGVGGLLREGLRALVEEMRRLLAFAALAAPLLLAGWVVPGAQLVSGPALAALTIFFLPLDYASYTLDRRHVAFAGKRRWLARHRGAVLGFGCAAFGICLVPGLNLLAMPVLVTGATLLALRTGAGEEPGLSRASGAGGGSSRSP